MDEPFGSQDEPFRLIFRLKMAKNSVFLMFFPLDKEKLPRQKRRGSFDFMLIYFASSSQKRWIMQAASARVALPVGRSMPLLSPVRMPFM